MSKRYYLAPVVGDGSEENAYRLKVADYGVNHTAVIASDPTTGRPVVPWGLAIVATPNHLPLLQDSTLDAAPDVAFDTKWTAIRTKTRAEFATRLQARGIDTSFLSSVDGFRDVIRHLGQVLDTNFAEDNFDVAE